MNAIERLLLLLLIVGALGAGGCAASGPSAAAANDRTGGVSLVMVVHTEDRQQTHYRVDPEGTLAYGGGMDVVMGEYSWTGPMSDDEIATLLECIERHGWFEQTPTDSPPGTRRRIDLSGPQGRRRFEVVGDAPGVVEVNDLLDAIALRRLDPVLESLPKPGPRD